MATRKAPASAPAHALDKSEGIIGERVTDEGVRIVVTTEGRKVILADDGSVVERLVGPVYDWEVESATADEPEG